MEASDRENLLVIAPDGGRTPYGELGGRLRTAALERGFTAELCLAEDLLPEGERLSGKTVLVSGPGECAGASGDPEGFGSRLRAADRRVAVLAEVAGEARPDDHGLFDAVFEVGFVSRQDRAPLPGTPYRFISDGPTEAEAEAISSTAPLVRRIPWAVAGPQTPGNVSLVAELVEMLDPGGFVFVPDPGMATERSEQTPDIRQLSGVLEETGYYVWEGSGDPVYYGSQDFVRALVSGAVPCRVRGNGEHMSHVPGSFESVEALCAAVQERGFHQMYAAAREFYLSGGTLGEHLEEALGNA